MAGFDRTVSFLGDERSADSGITRSKDRLSIALAVGFAAACYCWLDALFIRPMLPHRDFDQAWFAARALWHHQNPYVLIGPGKPFDWSWPFVYPMTAAAALLPLAWLPLLAARMVFVGLGAAALAYTIARPGYYRWPIFVSGSFLVAVQSAQWSPLLVALPWLAAVKPQTGAVMLIGRGARRDWWLAFVCGTVLSVIAVLLWPQWFGAWWHQARLYAGFASSLLVRPFGLPLLLVLYRWRDRDAWLLLSLAAIPHTVAAYDELPMFLIPRSSRQSLYLAVGSLLAVIVQTAVPFEQERVHAAYLLLMYWPAALMIVRRHDDKAAG